MSPLVDISLPDLLLAGGLMLLNIALSWALRLGLGRRLLLAGLRMSVQLLLVGSILTWVFRQEQAAIILGIGLVMAAIAGVAAVNRVSRRFPGVYWNSLVTVIFASFFVTGVALNLIIDSRPWYHPQYFIPLLGMVLGNTLNGISLGLDRFLSELQQQQGVVETRLALGATRWEAAHEPVREALRTGMIPTINSMMVMGVVSLPGMMTGQILAGAPPSIAVRYQIVIMFMIAAGTALGALGVVLLAYLFLFGADHRLRFEKLRKLKT